MKSEAIAPIKKLFIIRLHPNFRPHRNLFCFLIPNIFASKIDKTAFPDA
jgi:hypothetical protein